MTVADLRATARRSSDTHRNTRRPAGRPAGSRLVAWLGGGCKGRRATPRPARRRAPRGCRPPTGRPHSWARRMRDPDPPSSTSLPTRQGAADRLRLIAATSNASASASRVPRRRGRSGRVRWRSACTTIEAVGLYSEHTDASRALASVSAPTLIPCLPNSRNRSAAGADAAIEKQPDECVVACAPRSAGHCKERRCCSRFPALSPVATEVAEQEHATSGRDMSSGGVLNRRFRRSRTLFNWGSGHGFGNLS